MRKRKEHGFTMLEMMIVVAVVGILTALGAGPGKSFIFNRKAAAASRNVFNAIHHARMLAIKSGESCRIEFLGSSLDLDGDGSFDVDGDGNQIVYIEGMKLGVDSGNNNQLEDDEIDMEIDFKKNVYGTISQTDLDMTYNSRGILEAGDGATIVLWHEFTKKERMYNVVVNSLGIIRQESI